MSAPDERVLPAALDSLGRSWWVLLLYGLLAVIFGVFALVSPLRAAAALAWAIGIMALAEGLVSLFALFDRRQGVSRGWLLLYALLSIVFGVLTILNPLATASILLLLVAAWLIVGGIYRIVIAIRIRKQIEGEWLLILTGVLGIVLGALFVASPLGGLVVTTLWVGIGALLYGVLQMVVAFRVRGLKQR